MSEYGMLVRLSTGNVVGWCSKEDAIKELTDPEDLEDNKDLGWLPDNKDTEVLTVESLKE